MRGEEIAEEVMWDSVTSSLYLYTSEGVPAMVWKAWHGRSKGGAHKGP